MENNSTSDAREYNHVCTQEGIIMSVRERKGIPFIENGGVGIWYRGGRQNAGRGGKANCR